MFQYLLFDIFLEFFRFHLNLYKHYVTILKVWNTISSSFLLVLKILIIFSIFFLILFIFGTQINNPVSSLIPDFLVKYNNLFDYNSLIFVMKFAISICFELLISGVFFWIFFPIDLRTGLPDPSEFPAYHIVNANEKLKKLNLYENEGKIKDQKTEILNLLNNASEFITVEEKIIGIPLGFRFNRVAARNIKNKSVIKDINFRVNCMFLSFEKTMILLYNMNNDNEKEKVIQELNEYVEVLRTKNLSLYDPVEYTSPSLLYKLLLRNDFVEIIRGLLEIVPK